MQNQRNFLLSGRTRREKMENSFVLRCRSSRLWLVFLSLFLVWYFLLYVHDWSSLQANSNDISLTGTSPSTFDPSVLNKSVPDPIEIEQNEMQHETIHETRKQDNPTHEKDTETQPIGESKTKDKEETTVPSTRDTRIESSSAEVAEKQENADNSVPEVAEIIKESSETNTAGSGSEEKPATEETEQSPCSGRYIYVHNIPKRLNDELIEHFRSLNSWTDMCRYTANMGLGQKIPRDRAFRNAGWYETNQFTLEVIFHNRMKQYECLTTDSSKASAIFVPYYAGLDVARYLWGSTFRERDAGARDLYKWLKEQPEWEVMSGRDHFLVAGRITWDFRRSIDEDNAWGNNLMILPESQNVTMLTIESSPWTNNDFAIPYPTYFHPSSDAEVVQWQYRMRRIRRQYLYSYAGAPRPNLKDSIRGELMEQCRASGNKCQLLECLDVGNKCMKPAYLMRMFQSSVFCLQPPGDSFTRRSTFDSITGGCIPVFFHPGSAYVQYLWHLPKNYNKYSVLISENEVKNNKVSIEKVLESIPWDRVVRMREEVIKLIPKVTYADPRSRLETIEDAFDLTVKSVLQRVETLRKQMREGTYRSFDEEFSWKYNFYGRFGNREWDFYFNRTHNPRYYWQVNVSGYSR